MTPDPAAQINTRKEVFLELLNQPVIDVARLRALAQDGLPDPKTIRPLVWKLCLGYLPPQKDLWDRHLAQKRAAYAQFQREFGTAHSSISLPLGTGAVSDGSQGAGPQETSSLSRQPLEDSPLSRASLSGADHPLSAAPSSQWQQRFRDEETKAQIDRDVLRTHPELHFFSANGEVHRAAMAHALFVYAKLNPGIKYVQGMNELLAPLIYVFGSDPASSQASHAEADAFFCFVELMSDCRDHFCQQLDDSAAGIKNTLTLLVANLRAHDPELAAHIFDSNGITPQFFAFRWITLLLTQEFDLPDVLRLWDAVLAAQNGRQRALLRVCLAMLLMIRDELLEGDFAANVKLLQHYPLRDMEALLRKARSISLEIVPPSS